MGAQNYTLNTLNMPYHVPYNVLTNATTYGEHLDNIRYSDSRTGDRRSIKSTKDISLTRIPRTKQPLMKCYRGHCEKIRKYADVSGSKKDVLIGQLVPTMDPEDQGGGELDVAEI